VINVISMVFRKKDENTHDLEIEWKKIALEKVINGLFK